MFMQFPIVAPVVIQLSLKLHHVLEQGQGALEVHVGHEVPELLGFQGYQNRLPKGPVGDPGRCIHRGDGLEPRKVCVALGGFPERLIGPIQEAILATHGSKGQDRAGPLTTPNVVHYSLQI
jgi:hypothetical protein